MVRADMQQFLNLCLALTGERDREALLTNILNTAIQYANCDAGTLYLLEDNKLHFSRTVTLSLGVRQGGHNAPITLPPVPLEEKYVCSWTALHREIINVQDVRTDTHFDFTGSIRYDAMTGYCTKSMLVVPMSDDKGEVIGVTQLINALDKDGRTVAFDPEKEMLVQALASLSAICVVNMRYAEQLARMLDSLIGALSAAIDERSHYNANHSRNMARVGEAFLDWLDRTEHPWRFDADKRRTFLMSIWLHDVGKLVVPLRIMDKETRLGPALADIKNRFRVMALLDRISVLEGQLTPEEAGRRAEERGAAMALIERINLAGFLPDNDLVEVNALAARRFVDEHGNEQPWVTDAEYEMLSIRRGTLTERERGVMQSHVVVTEHILSRVAFPKAYADVPMWAANHHELLNGTGYPNHLTAERIPPEVRLLTILDIFDALTARDRPYKKPLPLEKSLSILRNMAEEGSVDPEILRLFEQSRAWEAVLNDEENA